MENIKRQRLSEFLTEEYLMDCMGDNLTLVEIAERTKKTNGGTCSTSTIHYWMKIYGLVPDTPRRMMKVGIKPEKLVEAYNLVDDTEIEIYKVVTYKKKTYVKNIVVMISDLQIGACSTAQGYDPIPEDTINKYVDTFLENLIQMFATRELQIDNIHLMLLGDIVDGELMFPKHKTINMSEQLKIAVKSMRRIIITLNQFATNGVIVHTVAGNHGRITHTHHRASNWDNVIYDTLELVYEGTGRVTIDSNRDFVKVVEIGGWQFLYTHGDVINGMITRQKAIIKSNGFHRRLPHHAMLMGHFHTTMYMNYNRMPIVVNGCMYDSDLIQNELAGWECKRMVVFKVSENFENKYPIDWLEMIDVE